MISARSVHASLAPRKWLALGLLVVLVSRILFPDSAVATALQVIVMLSLIWIAFFTATLDREVGVSTMRDAPMPRSRYVWRAHVWVLVAVGSLLAVAVVLWLVLRNR